MDRREKGPRPARISLALRASEPDWPRRAWAQYLHTWPADQPACLRFPIASLFFLHSDLVLCARTVNHSTRIPRLYWIYVLVHHRYMIYALVPLAIQRDYTDTLTVLDSCAGTRQVPDLCARTSNMLLGRASCMLGLCTRKHTHRLGWSALMCTALVP